MKGKRLRQKGKIRLGQYFQNLKEGDKVAIVREKSINANFPSRMQGRTGIVEGTRGRSYIVKMNDYNEEKRYIVQAIHLKKLVGVKKTKK